MQRVLNLAISEKLNKFIFAFHRFWFVTLDPFIIGLFRVILGLYFIFYFFMLAPNWAMYYGPNGISAAPTISISQFKLGISFLHYIPSDTLIWLYFGISFFCAVSLFCGALGKFPIIWLWATNFSIMFRNIWVVNGEEQIMGVILFYALFLPLNKTFRLSQLINKDKRATMFSNEERVETWALKPLQVYLALVYLFSFAPKLLLDYAWRNGELVYYSQKMATFPRWPDINIWAWNNAIISKIFTYTTLSIELLMPLLVWFKKLRLYCVLAALMLHLSLAIAFEGLMMFNLAFMVGLVSFLPSAKTKAIFKKLLS